MQTFVNGFAKAATTLFTGVSHAPPNPQGVSTAVQEISEKVTSTPVNSNIGIPAYVSKETVQESNNDDTDEFMLLTDKGGRFELPEEQRKFIALSEDGRLFIAESFVRNHAVFDLRARLDLVQFKYELHVTKLESISEIYANYANSGYGEFLHNSVASMDKTEFQQEGIKLIEDAMAQGASDIHIRVDKRKVEFWYRINGDMLFIRENIRSYGDSLCTALYQSLSDTSDTNFKAKERQDARIGGGNNKLPKGLSGVRLATTPTDQGFAMVCRLLTDNNAPSLPALGYSDQMHKFVNLMKSRPYGINIICGPTGSGKSTTLQRVLRDKIDEAHGKINVITVEDPVEYPIPGALQTSITNANTSEERKRKFEDAIRASLRLDPDVLMIGELRDHSSAELALHAALTGHQVWATIHANNPIGILDRLISMGLDRYLVADPNNVTGLICQNLVKTICPHCSLPYVEHFKERVSEDMARRVEIFFSYEEITKLRVKGDGCEHCGNTGRGKRTAIAELLVPDQEFMAFYLNSDKRSAITHWKNNQGGQSLFTHAKQKMLDGLVDPASVEEVLGNIGIEEIHADFRVSAQEVMSAS